MERKIVLTADGSATIHLTEWNEHYHSKHGAIQEALHVFIQNGLQFLSNYEELNSINILEIGFGTGLNALLTLIEAEKLNLNIHYNGVEAYPVSFDEVAKLNYAAQLKVSDELFQKLHNSLWNETQKIAPNFSIFKQQLFFHEIDVSNYYNLIYFDAFGARVQPELWTTEIFSKMYIALKPRGVLVTYSAKGSVRRAMIEVGFKVEKLPGPPGKREMLRAVK